MNKRNKYALKLKNRYYNINVQKLEKIVLDKLFYSMNVDVDK